MNSNSRLSAALHALLHMLAHDTPMTSEALAVCLRTNPVVVRRTLSGLRKAGLVRSQKGRGGGWSVDCDFATVTLLDVYRAVDSPALLASARLDRAPACPVEQSVSETLDSAFHDAEAQLLAQFGALTLAALAADIDRRIAERFSRAFPPHS